MATTSYGYQDEMIERVDGVVGQIETILTTKFEDLDDFVDKVEENMTYSVPFSELDFAVPGLDVAPYTGEMPVAPTLIESDPSYPSDFQLTSVTATMADFPTLDLAIPGLPTRTEPELQDLEFTGTEPAIDTNVPLPTMPTYTLPTAYTITPVTIRAFDGLTMPTWDGVFPTDDIGTLQADFNFTEPGFDSPITAALQTWITDGLENGGTGLAADIEAAIFANYTARMNEEFEAAYQKEMTFFSSRGYTRPPGALRGALQEISNQFNRRLAEASRDIMIKQAELAQNNTQFILQLAQDHEKSLQDFYQTATNRLLEVAKQAVVLAIAQHDARVTRYNATLEAYKTKAAVYESQIRAQMLLLEAYKAELEAGKLSIDMQMLYSQLYKDQLAGIGLLLDAYEKELRGASTFIAVNQSKIQLYQSQIQAFIARQGVDENRLKLFGMQIETDKSQIQLWAEKLKGLALEVDATKATNDSRIAYAALQNDLFNKTGIENYRLQLERIGAEIKNAELINAGRVQMRDSDVKAYSADVNAYAANVDAVVKSYVAQTTYAARQIELIIKEAEVNYSLLNSEHAVKIESLKSVVNAITQILASALSALHTSMTLGYSGGFNANYSYQPDVHVNHSHEFRDYCDATCGGTGE